MMIYSYVQLRNADWLYEISTLQLHEYHISYIQCNSILHVLSVNYENGKIINESLSWTHQLFFF